MEIPSYVDPKKVREVKVAYETTRMLVGNTVHSWGWDSASLTAPWKVISISGSYYFAIARGQDKIMLNDTYRTEYNVPGLEQIASNYNVKCSLAQGKVQCSGRTYYGLCDDPVPPLVNPRALTMGDQHACSITDDGVKCWGCDQVVIQPPADLTRSRQ